MATTSKNNSKAQKKAAGGAVAGTLLIALANRLDDSTAKTFWIHAAPTISVGFSYVCIVIYNGGVGYFHDWNEDRIYKKSVKETRATIQERLKSAPCESDHAKALQQRYDALDLVDCDNQMERVKNLAETRRKKGKTKK
jgi:hypothetical protein